MSDDADDNDTTRTVPVCLLALELGLSADDLAHRLGTDVFEDAVGFRVCTALRARELFLERDRRHAEELRRRAEHEEHLRALEQKRPVWGGMRQELPDGTLPVAAMLAASDKTMEGASYRPVPTSLDWAFDADVESGRSIGPSPAEVKRAAKERARQRAASKAKRGGT